MNLIVGTLVVIDLSLSLICLCDADEPNYALVFLLNSIALFAAMGWIDLT